jgi:hypothetical protein
MGLDVRLGRVDAVANSMRTILAFCLSALCLATPLLADQIDEHVIDLRKPNPAYRMLTTAGTTYHRREYIRLNGAPFTALTGWTGVLYYATSSSTTEGMVVTNTARGTGYFDWVLTPAQTAAAGTNFSQIVFYGPSGRIQEWIRGTFIIRGRPPGTS